MKILIIILLFLVTSCNNPFAPALNSGTNNHGFLGDKTTVDGIFQNWKYAYQFKDSVVYGNLLEDNFIFTYKNNDKGIDQSWNREQEMLTTYRLFTAAQNMDLVWNESVISYGDTTFREISRGFSLRVVFSPSDIIQIQGRATIELTRLNTFSIWKIKSWRDESNF
ncbi:MAG: hypothetical protein NTW25_15455 [Candidatus Kapabacteria bacterium]|nr:hypothetical protein [Candidatus Kapabacteria bacterium]